MERGGEHGRGHRPEQLLTATYNNVKVASLKLPVTAPEWVILQNQDGPITSCPFCQGPLRYPVTAWLSNIKIWNKQAKK